MTPEEIDAMEMAISLVQLALNNPVVCIALRSVKVDDTSLYDQYVCFMTEPAVMERLAQS